jgi:phosphoribosylformimino-5-aminoimidazole carboxamide ribotide isomerase
MGTFGLGRIAHGGPIQAAGGLRNEDTINDALAFAKKAVLGTFAFKNKEILNDISKNFGKERIIISTDQIKGKIVISGWQESTGIELIDGLESFVRFGFSQFLLTTVERDGTLQGPDLDSLQLACKIPAVRIIASGGISNLQDILNVKKCGANGVILGKALYDGKITVEEVKNIA